MGDSGRVIGDTNPYHPNFKGEKHVPRGSVWKHIKTGNLYDVVGIAICSTNGPANGTTMIVYAPQGQGGTLYCRDAAEWLDGRFVREEDGE